VSRPAVIGLARYSEGGPEAEKRRWPAHCIAQIKGVGLSRQVEAPYADPRGLRTPKSLPVPSYILN